MKKLELWTLMSSKTLQQSNDVFIQFSEEELDQLGWKLGEKLSCSVEGNTIKLEKLVPLELDLSEWPRELLHFLINESVERDVSVNDVICQSLEQLLKEFPNEKRHV